MLLNIDELIGEQKKIVFAGTEYNVIEPTLEIMLRAEKTLENAKDQGAEMEAMGSVIEMMIPGLDIKQVPVRTFNALFDYLMGKSEEAKNTEATVRASRK